MIVPAFRAPEKRNDERSAESAENPKVKEASEPPRSAAWSGEALAVGDGSKDEMGAGLGREATSGTRQQRHGANIPCKRGRIYARQSPVSFQEHRNLNSWFGLNRSTHREETVKQSMNGL
jgi:hypothetical protein